MKQITSCTFGFIMMIILAPVFLKGQDPNAICIKSSLEFGFSNTEHSLSIASPSLLPLPGTYNLTYLKYYDDPTLPSSDYNNPNVTVTVTPTEIVITDNLNSYEDLTQYYTGEAYFSNSSGSYKFTWFHNQLFCGFLPVTFISFTSQQYTSTSIKLNWTTADELNLSRYAVERSNNGSCFTQIGQVTALNTSGNHTYQFIDNQPFKNSNFYRIKSIDIDGHFNYSPIRNQSCPSCILGAPLATNCSSISIVGPASVCSTAVYTLSGISNCAAVTWTMTPLTNGTIVGNAVTSTVTKTGNGPATITATVAGCTGSFTKAITLGNPPPVIHTGVSKSLAFTRYTISITSPTLPSTSYTWYNNGSLFGTGYSKYYDVYLGDEGIYYLVNKNDACGVSSVGTTLYYQAPVDPCAGAALFTATKASGSSVIVINNLPRCLRITSIEKTNTATTSQINSVPTSDYEVRLIDFQGTIMKSVNHVSLKSSYNLDVSWIVPGNYTVLVINRGVVELSQKLRVD